MRGGLLECGKHGRRPGDPVDRRYSRYVRLGVAAGCIADLEQ